MQPFKYSALNSEVVFYIVGDKAQEVQAVSGEAVTALERAMIGTIQPRRFVHVLFVRTPDEQTAALVLIDEAMAAASFSDGTPAPKFEVIDLRPR